MLSIDEARVKLRELVAGVRIGKYADEWAKVQAEPYLVVMNQRMAEIARKHHRKHYPVDWRKIRTFMIL